MYTVFYTSVLAAFLAVAGMLHALYLPDRDTQAGALAANFLQYQRAAQTAALAAQAAGSSGSVPDAASYLPPGYAALGDWGLKTEGSVLCVYGKTGFKGNRRLAVADVWELAGKQTGTGIKQGSVLLPWSASLPAGIAAAIPEGAVVMMTRLK